MLDHRVVPDEEGEEGDTIKEYRVKWKCWSHLHNSYLTLTAVSMFVDGKEQVDAYEKKQKKTNAGLRGLGFDEKEEQAIRLEEVREQQAQWVQVERVLDHRFAAPTQHNPAGCDEYLVKWRGLDYDEISWEEEEDIELFQAEIEYYKQRVRNRPQHPTGGPAAIRRSTTYKELEEQPEYLEGGELRDYQLKGLSFIARQWYRNNSPILADEMGLGKTIQTISFLGYLQYGLGLPGPFLVVVPLSTMGAWLREFAKWCPHMNVVSYSGSKAAREKIQECEFYAKGQGKANLMFNALVTTYEYVLRDAPMLGKIKWTSLLVDEAHRLKNDASQLFKAMNDFHTDHRLLITGTPLQNTLRELWCLLFFLDHDTFGDFDDFEDEFAGIKDPDPAIAKRTTGALHTKLKDYMIRRVKRDVEKSLPNKIEQILRVEMSVMQRRYYKWILQRNFEELNRGLAGNEKSSLSNIIMELKKCCNHPYLFDNAENPGEQNKMYTMIHASGKLALLDKLLIRMQSEGHRVLIFSQMVRMLDILSDYLAARRMKHQRLDGSTSHLQRQRAMEHYNAPDSTDFVFLLSTRAGGLGINLTSADTVIIYDSDWNPQNDLQAQSRAHRIGQTKTVRIYRLTTKDTVEEDILNRAKNKMVLNHLVISQANKKDNSFTQKELAQITKFGAADLFKKDKDGEEEPQNDLDAILNKAEDVDFEGATQSSNEDLLGAFAVADVSTLPDPEPEPYVDPKWDDLATELKSVAKPQQYAQILHPDDQLKKAEAEAEKAKEEKEAEDAGRKRRNPQQRRGFSGQHKKAFVEAMTKYGDLARIKEMLLYAKVDDLIVHEAEAMSFGLQVIEKCKDAIENPPEEEAASDDDDKPIAGADGEGAPKKKTTTTPKATIDGIQVNAPELLFKVDALSCLNKVISKLEDPLQLRVCHMDPPQWAKNLVDVGGWSTRDDNLMLVGIWKHGFGTWEFTLRGDPQLKLERKIVERSSKDKEARARLASKNKLERRTKQLLFDLMVDQGGVDVNQPYFKLVQQLSRGAPKAVRAPKEPRQAGIGRVKVQKAPKQPKEKKERVAKKPKVVNVKKLQKLCKNLMDDQVGGTLIAKLDKAGEYEDPTKRLEKIKKALKNLGQHIDSYITRNQKSSTHFYGFASPDLELQLWTEALENSAMPAESTRDLYKKLAGKETGPVKDAVRKKSSKTSSKASSSRMSKVITACNHWIKCTFFSLVVRTN